MDIRGPGWYAQLLLSGVAKPINLGPGTILGLNAIVLKELQQLNPREIKDGKSICLLFAQKPFTADKATQENNEKLQEIAQHLDTAGELHGPMPGEDYAQFHIRLVISGLSTQQAKFIADDWFDQPPDAALLAWLHDPKAARFRQLNSSHAHFESALPGEYSTLKTYVLERYPSFCEAITFRTA